MLLGMRTQLVLGFVLIITVVVSTIWFFAIRTTNSEFEILISESNQRQARLIAPSILEEYSKTETWSDVQINLTQQIEQQAALSLESPIFDPRSSDGVIFNMPAVEAAIAQYVDPSEPRGRENHHGDPPSSLIFDGAIVELWQEIPLIEFGFRQDDNLFMIESFVGETPSGTIIVDSPNRAWLIGNITFGDQRILVFDSEGTIVVDTEKNLLGKSSDAPLTDGVTLYNQNQIIGTLVITSQNGVYTFEQNSFLQAVRQGFFFSGVLGTVLALLLAIGITYQVTRPVKLLTHAASNIQRGNWGYQVEFNAKNELGQLATAFNDMSRHLDEQRRLRVRLVDDLAHELNTPLSLMRLELQGMADGLQSPTKAAYHLNQELIEVSELVADLIFLASQDSARPREIDNIDINQIVQQTIQRFQVSTTPNIHFTPASQLPTLQGDAYLLQRAISNLLSNAIRHTPNNGVITITTKVTENFLRLDITDTGDGISPEHLPHIFDRFYRVDNSRNRGTGGKGLGLAIVKQILEQHNGTIDVKSHPNRGTTFSLKWRMS